MKMHKGVLKKVKAVQEKRGIAYTDTESVAYKWVKIIYILSFSYATFTNVSVIIGALMKAAAFEEGFGAFISQKSVEYATVISGALLIIAGFIALLKKLHEIALPLNLVPCVWLIFYYKSTLADELTLDRVYTKYYWRHLAPLALTALLALWLCFIGIRENLRLKRDYTKITEQIYTACKKNLKTDQITEAEWADFLENYDPENYKGMQIVKEESVE